MPRRPRTAGPRSIASVSTGLTVAVMLAGACGGHDPAVDAPMTHPTAIPPSTTVPPTTLHPATLPPATLPSTASTDLMERACRDELTVQTAGTLPTHLTSVSGLAAGRRHPDVVWAIEDSLEPPMLTALDLQGREVASIRVTGRPLMNLDWEDLAVGPGPDGEPWIHIADIGDNFGIRPEVRIHRFPEPELTSTSVEAETIDAGYESGRPNAEALFVDGAGGIWVIDKSTDGATTVYELDGSTLRPRATLELAPEQVTAADLSPDGTVLALRTIESVRLHRVEDGDVLAGLERAPCLAPAPDERQGESLAFTSTGDRIVTVSEDESGAPVDLHVIGR